MSSDPIKSDGAYELEAHDPSNSALNWRIHIGFVHGHLVEGRAGSRMLWTFFFSSFRVETDNHRSARPGLRHGFLIGWPVVLLSRPGGEASFDRRISRLSVRPALALASACSWAAGQARRTLDVALASGDEGVGLVF